MINASIVPYNQLPVNITKKEDKFINDTFKNELKKDRQKNTVRRNDDNGYGAALTCLSRDIVTATPDETRLIAAKMNFIQNLINNNLQIDANLRSQKTDDSCTLIQAKSDAYVKKAPHEAEIIRSAGESASKVVDSAANGATNVIESVSELTMPKLPQIGNKKEAEQN